MIYEDSTMFISLTDTASARICYPSYPSVLCGSARDHQVCA